MKPRLKRFSSSSFRDPLMYTNTSLYKTKLKDAPVCLSVLLYDEYAENCFSTRRSGKSFQTRRFFCNVHITEKQNQNKTKPYTIFKELVFSVNISY